MMYLAIDPGFSGALAWLDTAGSLQILDMPTLAVKRNGKNKTELDLAALAHAIALRPADRVTLEKVGAMPGQGTSSMFAFGRGVGQLEGIIAALQMPVSYAAPAAWKKAMQVPAGKDGARLRASQLMPAYAGEWRRAKDDGRAEAALIALYALTHGGGQ